MKLLIAVAALVAAAQAATICTKTYASDDCSGVPTNDQCVSFTGGFGCVSLPCTGGFGGGSTETTCTCFPADAKVKLEDGSTKEMRDVKVGDRVAVGNGKHSDVYMFSHRIEKAKVEFVKLTTAAGNTLRLTGPHYIYANGELTPAWKVKVGDKVVLETGNETHVTHVDKEWAEGLYNPHTLQGDIVVDGIKTSSYTTAVHPTVAHAILAPVRALYQAGINVYGGALEKVLPLLKLFLPAA